MLLLCLILSISSVYCDYLPPPPSASQRVKLCSDHPNIDEVLAKGAASYTLPSTHPTVHPLLSAYIGGHDNLDNLLQRGKHYDGGHIHLIPQYAYFPPSDQSCYSFYNNYINASGCPAIATPTHPSIDASIAAGTRPPNFHPLIDGLLRPFMPASHRDLDYMLANGIRLPVGHPPIDPYLCTNGTWTRPNYCAANTSGFHPPIDSSIGRGTFPSGHPLVDPLLREYMPVGHPDADELLIADTPLPLGHPVLDSYVCRGPSPASGCSNVPSSHPLVDQLLRESAQLPRGHPKVDPLLRDLLPDGHGNCDAYIANGTPIPAWHPNIDAYICLPCDMSAGLLLSIIVAAIFGISVVYRHYRFHIKAEHKYNRDVEAVAQRRRKSSKRMPKKSDIIPDAQPNVMAVTQSAQYCQLGVDDEFDSVEVGKGDINVRATNKMESVKTYNYNQQRKHAQKPLPRRNRQLHAMETLHAQHKGEDLYPYEPKFTRLKQPINPGRVELAPEVAQIVKLKEKRSSSWGRFKVILNQTRLPFGDWTLGNFLSVLLYLSLNVLCLFLGCSSDYGRSWGSLAAANSMLLIFPAARNSILTLGLGLAFDHAVVYHRFIGRFAILCVVIHGWYFLDYLNRRRFAFVTGVAALACGLVIFFTSLNYVRRNVFNLFYWSHYSFVGYLTLAYFHVPQTQPFILVGAGLYVTDKLLRCLWMLWPHQTIVFRTKGVSTAHVRFPKNPITRHLEMHNVGQYYFVNFPELSLSEWHPFSVSSGPREESIEMHIRSLGDHTRRIVALAAEKEKTNESATILIDGPYGQQNFNYRRYPMILLAAGGIGVTPVMGMLKDIYDVGMGDGKSKPVPQPNAIETIYFLWAMPKQEDYEHFREDIELCLQRSREGSAEYPSLVPLIYITRSKEELEEPFIAGRPQLSGLFERMMQEHSEDQTGLVFACGPQPLVAELWDKSIEHTLSGRQIDFHHEVFEF